MDADHILIDQIAEDRALLSPASATPRLELDREKLRGPLELEQRARPLSSALRCVLVSSSALPSRKSETSSTERWYSSVGTE